MKIVEAFAWTALLGCLPLPISAQGIPLETVTHESLVDQIYSPKNIVNLPNGQSGLVVSPDGRRLAYVSNFGGKSAVVVDGREGKIYDKVEPFSLSFSPDSKRIAYVASTDRKEFAVVDGMEGEPYFWCTNLTFSPDSRRVAYRAGTGSKVLMVIDGKAGKLYDECGNPFFSPDGKRVAYVATVWNKQVVVVDGKEGEPYDWGYDISIIFSPGNKQMIYKVWKNGKYLMVIDGKETEPYPGGPGYGGLVSMSMHGSHNSLRGREFLVSTALSIWTFFTAVRPNSICSSANEFLVGN